MTDYHDYTAIAAMLIKQGRLNTTTGNWIFYRGTDVDADLHILAELIALEPCVADIVVDDDALGIVFFTNYCPRMQ